MIEFGKSQRGSANALLLIVVALAAICISWPLVLHYTQKAHNRLPFEVDQQFPPDKPAKSGEIYAGTIIAIVDRELSGWSGWRPNDFPLWRHTFLGADNNANRQIGIIQAVRESVRVFRDNLTKVSATEYDENLRVAETLFRNDEKKFWFPSAESRFRQANQALRRYINGLYNTPPTSKPINQRNVELMNLFQAWTDQLGGAHADLYKSRVSFWQTDDYFYRAQGYAHVMHQLMHAVRREYAGEIDPRPPLNELFAEVTDALGKAAVLKPLMVLDSSPTSIFANHRHNLDVFINDARQKMYSIREELEK